MEITGRIIAVLPVQGGISKNGNEWKKQEYVLETHDQYPKKVCFQIFGADRIDQAAIQPGAGHPLYRPLSRRRLPVGTGSHDS